MDTNLTDKARTIASYLRSAALKFEDIAADCRKPDSSPGYASLAQTFDTQALDAIALAELFENADNINVETWETDTLGVERTGE
jgi:hypothetical protein